MKKVITYGTFDLLHKGHINIIKKAKELGDYLIVGVTSEDYDFNRGKLNVQQSLMERINNVKSLGIADEIIIEEYFGQKINDIKKYDIDIFAIGSDWLGKFDYLKEYCDVVYIERTKGISSTELRDKYNSIVKLGIVGYGRIANRMMSELPFVSGVTPEAVFGRNEEKAELFANKHELNIYSSNYDDFLEAVDAIYIATPHKSHFEYAKQAILKKKHVLCEKPMTLSVSETKYLFELAHKNNVVLQEAIKTAYAPAFIKLVNIAKSGIIGQIKNVNATFTKLIEDKTLREYNHQMGGGSITELISYPLCAIVKLLGLNYNDVMINSIIDDKTNVDILSTINIIYENAIATANVGIGVKTESDLRIGGTKGYIYVPAPWWKTEYFEIRAEDPNKIQKFFTKYDGEGLRYEISDFINTINNHKAFSYKLKDDESIFFSEIIEKALLSIY